MHIAGGAGNRFVLDKPMAAAAAPMGLAGHGAAGLSSLLNEGLARAKDLASKLDIAVDRTEISSRESTVLTVMGTGHGVTREVTHGHELRLAIERSASVDTELDRAILCRLPGYPHRSRERDAAIDSIASFSHHVALNARKESSEAMREAMNELHAYTMDIKAHLTQLIDTLKNTHDGVSHIAKEASSQDVLIGKRIEAKLRFTSDEAFIVSKRKFTNDIESRVTSTHTRKLELEQQQSLYTIPDRTIEDQIKALDGNLTRWERDLKRIEKEIISHFTSGMHSTSTHTPNESIPLSLPKQLGKDKGVSLIKVTLGYAKTHIVDYADIIPYLERVAHDKDTKTGLHYEPPSIHDGYKGVNPVCRHKYASQSLMLYNQFVKELKHDIGIIERTQSRFEVGKYATSEKDQRIAYPNDGVYLFFSLICLYEPASSTHSGRLTKAIYGSDKYFTPKNDLVSVATMVKQQIVQCNNSAIKLIWGLSGKPIIDRLHTVPQYASLYDKYLDGGDDPDYCNTHLDKLLTEIIRIAKGRPDHTRDAMQAHDASMHEDEDDPNDDQYHAFDTYMHDDESYDYIEEQCRDYEEEKLEAMWSRGRPHERSYGGKGKGKGRGRSGSLYPRPPSAGPSAARHFGRSTASMPYRRAYSAEARPTRPAQGKCHAKGYKAQGLAQNKTLCLSCIGKGKRNGKLTMYDGKEQPFRRPDAPQAHDVHMDDDNTYDDEIQASYNDHDDIDMNDYEAFMANAAKSYVGKKRSQRRPAAGPAAKQQRAQGMRAMLAEAIAAQDEACPPPAQEYEEQQI